MRMKKDVPVMALKPNELNVLDAQVGDTVRVKTGNEPVEGKNYTVAVYKTGKVVEIDSKGRWFRVKFENGTSRCQSFVDKYSCYRKFNYKIIERGKGKC